MKIISIVHMPKFQKLNLGHHNSGSPYRAPFHDGATTSSQWIGLRPTPRKNGDHRVQTAWYDLFGEGPGSRPLPRRRGDQQTGPASGEADLRPHEIRRVTLARLGLLLPAGFPTTTTSQVLSAQPIEKAKRMTRSWGAARSKEGGSLSGRR